MFPNTFGGIAPGDVPAFLARHFLGGAAGWALVRLMYSDDAAAGAAALLSPPFTADPRHPTHEEPPVTPTSPTAGTAGPHIRAAPPRHPARAHGRPSDR